MDSIDTGTEELLCYIEERVATITLNKPHKKNALGDTLTPALRETIALLEHDNRVGSVLITGKGDAFCAGGDVSGMGSNRTSSGRTSREVTKNERIESLFVKQRTLTQRIHELDKITIAALPGAAAGAGLSIALACDLRIASSNAFVTTAFANVGLSGDYGASWFLPRIVGLSKAKEMFYTSDRISAEECERLGIFNKLFPTDTFRDDAQAYAAKLSNGPINALARMKKNLNSALDQELQDSLLLEARHLVESMDDPESKEAIAAFMEKRRPNFNN